MYLGTLLMISIGLIGAAAWFIFRRCLGRDARYERRLRRRNKIDWENEKLRQERLLEVRMRQIHGKGLRWNEDIAPEEVFDRGWSRASEERISKLD